MIHYTLRCDDGHEFDGWFKDSAAFDKQAKRGYVECPTCGGAKVSKQFSVFATHGAGEQPSFGATAAGGGCCGGSCGCGH